MSFKDHFSKQSDLYVQYRPQYPVELFSFLASLTPEHQTAWDCGTGNGQAATGLTPYFQKIIATDPSESQIKNSLSHPKIIYRTEPAESTSIPSHSIDLVTIAQALHWFHFEEFYQEVRRVLKKEGIIATWCYRLPSFSKEMDEAILFFHSDTLGDYWLAENRMVEQKYATIPFPFETIEAPIFYIRKKLSFHGLIGHIRSWSALQKFMRENNEDPVPAFEKELLKIWGDPEEEKSASWKLTLKVGRNKEK